MTAAGPLNVSVTTGSDIVCTITNTSETGKLEVVKDLNPSTDAGKFNLQIDGSSPNAGSQNVGDGGTTGEQTLNTGTHTVGETAGTITDLADYQKSISCVDTANSNAAAGSTTGDSAGPLNVEVTTGSDIVCTITNTRETGKLEVRQGPEPDRPTPASSTSRSTAPPNAGAQNVGDGGTTGEQTLNTGTHTVGEAAGTCDRPGRLPEVDQLRRHREQQRGGRLDLRRQRGTAERERHHGLRHRLHDHEHPRDGQARGREGPQPDHRPGRFNLQIDGIDRTRTRRTSATAARPASRRSTPAPTPSVRRP